MCLLNRCQDGVPLSCTALQLFEGHVPEKQGVQATLASFQVHRFSLPPPAAFHKTLWENSKAHFPVPPTLRRPLHSKSSMTLQSTLPNVMTNQPWMFGPIVSLKTWQHLEFMIVACEHNNIHLVGTLAANTVSSQCNPGTCQPLVQSAPGLFV